MKKFLKEFSAFLKQGNLMEVATGLLMATAFKDLVTSFSNTFILPIINKLLGMVGSYEQHVTLFGIDFQIGNFITSLISFVIILFVLFLIVKAYNKFLVKQKQEQEETSENELTVLKEIKALLEKSNNQ